MIVVTSKVCSAAQIRTELVAKADSTGSCIVSSARAPTTAITAATMQAVMKARMVNPSGKRDSLTLYNIPAGKTGAGCAVQ